ncbi:MAG: hypothetical protein LC775_13755, partial [Acidobacteria bacterium]|nr:hypothetical protein [Acidobacteriota bacterium]
TLNMGLREWGGRNDPVPTVFTHNRDRLLEGEIVTYPRQVFGSRDTMHDCDDTPRTGSMDAPFRPFTAARRGFGGPGGGV